MLNNKYKTEIFKARRFRCDSFFMLRNAGGNPDLHIYEKVIVSVRHGPTRDASDKVLNDNKNIATR